MYALYKGKECLAIGTIPELANKLGVQLRTIQYYGTEAYKRKSKKRKNARSAKILIRVEEEE